MTDAGDIRRMQAIAADLRRWDVVVREVPGWEQRGQTWARVPVGFVEHYDVSSIKSGEWGVLGYITANTLAQFQGARCLDGIPKVAIVAAGVCWHAGKGSYTFPDGLTIPTDAGNFWMYGMEVANNGVGEPYTDALHYAIDATGRAVLERCD